MREEIKMKQGILFVALILLFCGYYLTPQTPVKNKDSVESAPHITNTQMQPVEISRTNYGFEKTDSIFKNTVR